jgi:hypothetical protein
LGPHALGAFILVTFEKGQRKDDVAHEYLAKFEGDEGVLFVGKAQEKASVFRTEKRRPDGSRYPWIIRSKTPVNHCYVYILDRDFGPLFIKFCSYFPYAAKALSQRARVAETPAHAAGHDREVCALVEDIRVRVINCSAAGCLLESDRRIAEGTIATLHLSIGGRTFSEVAAVVRCQPVDRRNGLYHVGAQFLSTMPPHAGSLRYGMRRECSELAGWLMGGMATSSRTNVPCCADNQTGNVSDQS